MAWGRGDWESWVLGGDRCGVVGAKRPGTVQSGVLGC